MPSMSSCGLENIALIAGLAKAFSPENKQSDDGKIARESK